MAFLVLKQIGRSSVLKLELSIHTVDIKNIFLLASNISSPSALWSTALSCYCGTHPAKTITISTCCYENTWNSSNQTATAGLRPPLGKNVREQNRAGRSSDNTKRKLTEAEWEKANEIEAAKGKDWQWWNRDVKETKKRTRVGERSWENRHESTIYLSCALTLASAPQPHVGWKRC